MFLNKCECSEEKKVEFRKYLEEHGILDAISDIFNKIITAKEKPENPIDFIRHELGDTHISQETNDNLEHELEEAHREIRTLRQKVESMGLGKRVKSDSEVLDEPSNAEC